MDIQLLKYIPTPGEKQVGIAVVRFERRFIFRLKLSAKQEGGYWVQAPALKTGSTDGKDRYEAAFQLDSSYEWDEVRNFVLDECLKLMRAAQPQAQAQPMQASALASPAPRPAWMPPQNQTDLPF